MEDSTENSVKIYTRDEALNYVNTAIREKWDEYSKEGSLPSLGKASLEQELQIKDHKIWQYHIEGLPQSRDRRQRWLLDTGETFDTTLNEDENTPEKALGKLQSKKRAED